MVDLVKLGNKISQNTVCIVNFIAKYIIRNLNDNTIFLEGGAGLEEVIDKNYYLKNNLSFTTDADIKITEVYNSANPSHERVHGPTVHTKLLNLHSMIPDDIWKRMFPFFTTIVEVVTSYETLYRQNLTYLKPTLADWNNAKTIFDKNKFKLTQRVAMNGITVVHFIYYEYKGLTIPIVEASDIISELKSEYRIDAPIRLLNPKYFKQKLEILIKPDSTYPKKIQATARLQALTENLTDVSNALGALPDSLLKEPLFKHVKPFINFPLNQSLIKDSILQQYLNSHRLIISANKLYKESLNCYSFKGDGPVNSCLLEKEMFGIESKNMDLVLNASGNADCDGKSPRNLITNINNAMNACNMSKHGIIDLIRCTYPSVYSKQVIEKYNIRDTFTIPNLVSTSYKATLGNSAFTTIDSSMVIFQFIISDNSAGNFIFMESASIFPNEYEVLLKNNLTYKILSKEYKLINFGNNILIQKLVLILIINGDDTAETHFNNNINNYNYFNGNHLVNAPVVGNINVSPLDRSPLYRSPLDRSIKVTNINTTTKSTPTFANLNTTTEFPPTVANMNTQVGENGNYQVGENGNYQVGENGNYTQGRGENNRDNINEIKDIVEIINEHKIGQNNLFILHDDLYSKMNRFKDKSEEESKGIKDLPKDLHDELNDLPNDPQSYRHLLIDIVPYYLNNTNGILLKTPINGYNYIDTDINLLIPNVIDTNGKTIIPKSYNNEFKDIMEFLDTYADENKIDSDIGSECYFNSKILSKLDMTITNKKDTISSSIDTLIKKFHESKPSSAIAVGGSMLGCLSFLNCNMIMCIFIVILSIVLVYLIFHLLIKKNKNHEFDKNMYCIYGMY